MSRRGRGIPWLKVTILAVIVVGAVWIARITGLARVSDLPTLAATVQRVRGIPWAPPAFVAFYAIVATVGLPALPLTLAGGALFGTIGGTALNWVGATLGATGAFLLARALGRDALVGILGSRAGALDRLTETHGFATLLRLRLIPVVPFNAINFGAGAAGVPLRPYLAATALGIIPGTAVYTYFADALLSGAGTARHEAFIRVFVAGALLIALSFVPALARRLGIGVG